MLKNALTTYHHAYFKIMLKILQVRIQQYVNWEFPDVQAGFRKGRGIRNQIINICWVIKKAREFQKNIYFCFIDYTKVFDCVDHKKLWKILQEMRVPDYLTCLLRNLCAGQETTVRTGHETMDWFQVGKGVRQGCILSPRLFSLYAEYIMQNVGLDDSQIGNKITRRNNNFRYADDTTLMAESAAAAKSLQSCLTLCNPRDVSPPGSPIPGILQARTLEWVAISFSNAWKWRVKVKSLSRVRLLATPWTAAYQAPLSMGFSRQEYWSGVPEEELKNLLIRVKKKSENTGLKLRVQNTKIMAFGAITSWQIEVEKVEAVTDFIFLGSKITVDGDHSHEIRRCLLLGRKAMINLDSILKSRDIILPTNIHIVKAMVFPVAICKCESWTLKKAEHRRIVAFKLWCWRRLLWVPWMARRSNQSILKEIKPEYSLEGLMLKLKLL